MELNFYPVIGTITSIYDGLNKYQVKIDLLTNGCL